MELTDFPPEIFEKIIHDAMIIRAEGLDQSVGVCRALRLKLVCKLFYQYVEPALFETGLLIDLEMFNPGRRVYTPDFLQMWKLNRNIAVAKFWQRYLLYLTKKETDRRMGRFAELKEVTQVICDEMGVGFNEALDDVCWVVIESRALGSVINPGDSQDRSPAATIMSRNLNALAVAAYLGHLPLARKLVQMADPDQDGIFLAPIELAAIAGHHQMLAFLQDHIPTWVLNKPDERYSKARLSHKRRVRGLGIAGAARNGDFRLLKEAADRSLIDHPEKTLSHVETQREAIEQRRVVFDAGVRTRSIEIWRHAEQYRQSVLVHFYHIRPLDGYEKHEILCRGCWQGNLDLVRIMIDEHGAKIDGVDPICYASEYITGTRANYFFEGMQPISVAARAMYPDIVEFLLKRGATPNLGRTLRDTCESPLACAAQAGSLAIAKMLLDHGAEVDIAAFKNAAKVEHLGILRLLRYRCPGQNEGLLTVALWESAVCGHESMFSCLVKWGASLKNLAGFSMEKVDRERLTVAKWAKAWGAKAIARQAKDSMVVLISEDEEESETDLNEDEIYLDLDEMEEAGAA